MKKLLFLILVSLFFSCKSYKKCCPSESDPTWTFEKQKNLVGNYESQVRRIAYFHEIPQINAPIVTRLFTEGAYVLTISEEYKVIEGYDPNRKVGPKLVSSPTLNYYKSDSLFFDRPDLDKDLNNWFWLNELFKEFKYDEQEIEKVVEVNCIQFLDNNRVVYLSLEGINGRDGKGKRDLDDKRKETRIELSDPASFPSNMMYGYYGFNTADSILTMNFTTGKYKQHVIKAKLVEPKEDIKKHRIQLLSISSSDVLIPGQLEDEDFTLISNIAKNINYSFEYREFSFNQLLVYPTLCDTLIQEIEVTEIPHNQRIYRSMNNLGVVTNRYESLLHPRNIYTW